MRNGVRPAESPSTWIGSFQTQFSRVISIVIKKKRRNTPMTERGTASYNAHIDKMWNEDILPGLTTWAESPENFAKIFPIVYDSKFLDMLGIPASVYITEIMNVNPLVGKLVVAATSPQEKSDMVEEVIDSLQIGMILGIYMWEKAQGRIPQKGEENAQEEK
jgi:hypothetical protein